MFLLRRTHDRIVAGLQGELRQTIAAYRVQRTRAKRARTHNYDLIASNAKLKAETQELRERAAAADKMLRGLIERMTTPPKAPAPVEHPDPEAATLTAISDDTVKRMTEQFVRDGLGPDVAEAHARDLVNQAERMWGAMEATL